MTPETNTGNGKGRRTARKAAVSNGKAAGSKNDVLTGNRIRTARIAAGLSQAVLGKKLGVTFQQVQKYEKGTNRVGTSRISIIARETNKPVTYFFPDVSVHRSERDEALDAFMATKEAHELLDVLMAMPKERRQSVLVVARQLADA